MIFESKTSEYCQRVDSLQYLTNKHEFNHDGSFKISNNLIILIVYLERESTSYYVSKYGIHMTISLKNGTQKMIYDCNYGLNSGSVQRIFTDKIVCAEFLRHYKLPVPQDYLVLSTESQLSNDNNNISGAIAFADKIGYPLFCKPVRGSLGRGVKKVFNQQELIQELEMCSVKDPYMLQEPCAGNDYRVLYLNGEILVAYQREHPYITGDGLQTINQLISQTKAYTINPENVTTYLLQQGLHLSTIVQSGEQIQILPTANISTGGTVKVYNNVSQSDIEFMQNIAEKTGSNYFGADILTSGAIHEGIILELNSTPRTQGICENLEGFAEYYGAKIWKAIKESEGIME